MSIATLVVFGGGGGLGGWGGGRLTKEHVENGRHRVHVHPIRGGVPMQTGFCWSTKREHATNLLRVVFDTPKILSKTDVFEICISRYHQ